MSIFGLSNKTPTARIFPSITKVPPGDIKVQPSQVSSCLKRHLNTGDHCIIFTYLLFLISTQLWFPMPGVQTAFAVASGGSRAVGLILYLMIWSEDSNEWPGISVLLIVPGDLELFEAILLFNLTNAFAIVSARLYCCNCPPSHFSSCSRPPRTCSSPPPEASLPLNSSASRPPCCLPKKKNNSEKIF